MPFLPMARQTAGQGSVPARDRSPACPPCRGFRPRAGHLPPGLGAAEGADPRDTVVTDGTPSQQMSHGPGVELEGAGSPRGEGGVEDVAWVERLHPVD